jgi:hypothetical protein
VPKEKLIRLPDKDDAPEWQDVFNRLGRPEKAEGYTIEVPKEHGDEEFAKWARGMFHELGFSKRQGDKLSAEWNKRAAESKQAQEQIEVDKSHQQFSALKQEWGAGFDAKVRAKNEFVGLAGITPEQHQQLEAALGVDGFAKIMDGIITKFGVKLGEHQFHGGGGGNNFGSMTPEGARAKKELLLSDPAYTKRYLDNGASERAEIAKLEEFIWMGGQTH